LVYSYLDWRIVQMTEERYNDILVYALRIGNFKTMVASESKRPLAIRTLKHIAEVEQKEATEFVTEYYNNMDVKFGDGNKLSNEFKRF
jgi:hypothetical protein